MEEFCFFHDFSQTHKHTHTTHICTTTHNTTRAPGQIMYGLRHWYLWNVHHLPKCIICHKTIVMITGRTHCFHNNRLRRKPWPISSFALIYVTDTCTMAKLKKPDKNKIQGTHHALSSCSLGHCFYSSFLFGTRETLEMYHQISYASPTSAAWNLRSSIPSLW